MTTTVRLRCVADSTVNQAMPARNYGDQPGLALDGSGDERRVFLNFPIKSLPPDANVHNATLRLHLRGDDWTGSNEITAQRVDEKWSEGKVNWNNQPGVAGVTADVTVASGAAGDIADIDVTTLVAAAVERDKVWHGIRLVVDTSGRKLLHSSEVADHSLRPHLIVEYSAPPTQPVRLRPRGQDSVNASQPRLAWDADSQSESRVQVNSADDFSSPDYDSGWVVNDETGWDLAAATSPTFSALSDGEEFFWRVKVKDEDGNESDWSNSAHAYRNIYGTFDITSPAVDGDGVDDASPTIVTSLTGRTQTRLGWRIQISDPDLSGGAWLTFISTAFETGFATDDSSFELPKQTVTRRDVIGYRVQVRVWDEFDRGTAVGERSYLEASRIFIYDPTPGVGAPATIAVTQPEDGHPLVRVSVTRSSAPDTFDVYMDDELVMQQVEPGDAFVSGTTYAFDLWDVAPGIEHTFEVVATVNHNDSTSNPTADYTPVVLGAWLLCPEIERSALITGHNQPETIIGEIGETFTLLNRRQPVRITDGLRGMEGSLSGRIRTTEHGTTAEMRRNLIRIKEVASDSEVRLVLPYQNFPVFLGELRIPLTPPAVDQEYDVSIEFWQDGEFEVRK